MAAPLKRAAASAPNGHLRAFGAAGFAIAVVLPLASSTSFSIPSWELRWAVLPAIAAIGLVALRGALHLRAGVAAAVWLGWAAVSAALAPSATVALWGVYRIGTGLVFVVALAGGWAIGLRGGSRGPRLVTLGLLLGCVLNALIAIASQYTDLGPFGAATYQSRSAGLFGNPVYLAELLCGGLWLAMARASRSRGFLAVATVVAAGIELSGSRAGLAVAVVLGVAAGWRYRRWLLPVAVVAGIALGALVGQSAGSAATGTERVATANTTGYRSRIEVWEEGLTALAHRPVWGWGPGDFLAAAGPQHTLALARAEGPDAVFADAHDWVVEHAVTTGVVGIGLLLWFLWSAFGLARRAASPWGLSGFAAGVLAVGLFEPQHPGVTPLAFLALGAAAAPVFPGRTTQATRAGGVRVGAVGVGAVGLAASVWFALALAALHSADVAGSPSAAMDAARRLPAWGATYTVVGQKLAFDEISTRASLAPAESWWARAAHRDSPDPSPWLDLAGALAKSGDPAGAAADLRHALRDNPWSLRGWSAMLQLPPEVTTPAERAEAAQRVALLRR